MEGASDAYWGHLRACRAPQGFQGTSETENSVAPWRLITCMAPKSLQGDFGPWSGSGASITGTHPENRRALML